MRIVFAGTPEAAVPTLRALAQSEHEVLTVVTRPDAPQGRKRVLTPSPVAQAAEELGIPTIKAAKLDEAVTAQITALEPELGVIVAYGGLVREPLLSTPTHGWINLHFSLLPEWRGAAPVQRAIIAGDKTLGASIFQLVSALDAGDVFATQTSDVSSDATAAQALEQLATEGAPFTVSVVDQIADGSAVAVPQAGEATYAAKLNREDGILNLTQAGLEVYNRFRGVTPEPGAVAEIAGIPVKILESTYFAVSDLGPGEVTATKQRIEVGTGSGALLITRVQPPGKPAMNAVDWWRGVRK